MTSVNKKRPLDGMRVIEMGQLIAGPFTGSVLGYFGAEVIKIEPPTGDLLILASNREQYLVLVARCSKNINHAESKIR